MLSPLPIQLTHILITSSFFTVPKTFLLVAGQNSLRRIALDNPSGEYVDIPLYDSLDGYDVNAVDYLLTARGEGYIYIAEMRSPSGIAGDNVWRYFI